ncbi:MAG: hypothetical protein H6625_06665 [Bdellovibrionaceae bacterium]|nr:hypothetical protein [Pseudobdellovibrionaceae bacterium]
MNNKGQATIESLYSLILSFAVVALMGSLIMGSTLKVWVDHFSYETAICLSSYPSNETSCKEKFQSQVKALWPLGELHLQSEKKTLLKLVAITVF